MKRFLLRELEAINRDREFSKKERRSFSELIEHLDTYPSVFRRIKDFYYAGWRLWDRFIGIPQSVTWFVQRGRRGWSDRDVWNVDAYFVETMIPLLEHYKENNVGHPMHQTPEEHDEIIDKIIHGLRQYQLYQDNCFDLSVEDDIEANEKAVNALADACTLLGKSLPGIWI